MLDFGFDKIALIGAVALIVIGPEKLPRVARTVGTLLGKAQRYVADVKAEVNRSIELDELHKMKSEFESAAREMQESVHKEVEAVRADISRRVSGFDASAHEGGPVMTAAPAYRPPRKNWRLKRSALPAWYKQRHGVRLHVQSGAARVARFRPRGPWQR